MFLLIKMLKKKKENIWLDAGLNSRPFVCKAQNACATYLSYRGMSCNVRLDYLLYIGIKIATFDGHFLDDG